MNKHSPLLNQSLKFNYLYPLLAHLPHSLAYRLASLYGRLQRNSRSEEQQIIMAQMRHVFSQHNDRQLAEWADYYFGLMEREELDTFYYQRMNTPKKMQNFIRLVNVKPLLEARKSGKRIIISSGHFGRFWMAGVAIRSKGVTAGTITRDGSMENVHGVPEAVYQFRLNKLRWLQTYCGGPFLIEGDSVRSLYRALDEHVMALLIDVPYTDEKEGCIALPFLGQTGNFPIGAAKIAKRTNALIFPFYVFESREGPEVHFFDAIEAQYLEEAEIMAQLVNLLQEKIIQRPELWWLWQVLPLIWK